MNIAILISGGGSNMACLIAAMQSGHIPAKPALVISNRADAGGLAKAAAAGVPTMVIDHTEFDTRAAFDARIQQALENAEIDFICLAGFMRILTADFVTSWDGKMMNIHPSLLPSFKGLHTHARALETGVSVHGCTAHLVTPELDDGPILGQAVVPVKPGDTPETLAARVLEMEHILYPTALRAFAQGDVAPICLGLDNNAS